MSTAKTIKFKGEIAQYLDKNETFFHSRIQDTFKKLKTKTALCRSNIRKKDGYHTFHLLSVLMMLPIFKLSSVNKFCVKNNKKFPWRALFYHFNLQIFKEIKSDDTPRNKCSFIIDDTVIQKRGKKIQNLSYVHDHS